MRLCDQFRKVPHMISDACRHRRRHADRPVNPAEIVVGDPQPNHRPEVRQLLRETIRQPGESPHLHPERQVIPLDVRRADTLRTWTPLKHGCLDCDDFWGTVSPTASVLLGVLLHDLGVVHFGTKRALNRIGVGSEGVGAQLDSPGHTGAKLADESPRRAPISLANQDDRHQLADRIERDERVGVAQLAAAFFFGRQALLLLPHVAPNLISLDFRAPEIAHSLAHDLRAPFARVGDQAEDGGLVDARHAGDGTDGVTFDQRGQDCQLLLVFQNVHGRLRFSPTESARARYTTTGLTASSRSALAGSSGWGYAVLAHCVPQLKIGAPEGDRTPNNPLSKRALSPIEVPGRRGRDSIPWVTASSFLVTRFVLPLFFDCRAHLLGDASEGFAKRIFVTPSISDGHSLPDIDITRISTDLPRIFPNASKHAREGASVFHAEFGKQLSISAALGMLDQFIDQLALVALENAEK